MEGCTIILFSFFLCLDNQVGRRKTRRFTLDTPLELEFKKKTTSPCNLVRIGYFKNAKSLGR